MVRDMEPYVDCALQRSESRQRRNGNQRRVRAAALDVVDLGLLDPLGLVGESEVIGQIRRSILALADTNVPVLLRGETGTGKELIARAIHFKGVRKNKAFVCENCAAVTETLLEALAH